VFLWAVAGPVDAQVSPAPELEVAVDGEGSELDLAASLATGAESAAADEVEPEPEAPKVIRRPERLCTITVTGDAQCVSVAKIPSRPVIEHLLRKLGEENTPALRCVGEEQSVVRRVKRLTRRLGLSRNPPSRVKVWDTGEWSIISLERAEQNILALLRSCHAVSHGETDPVATGEVPSGAPPREEAEAEIAGWSAGGADQEGEPSEPPASEAQAIVIHEPQVRDAEGLPSNPFGAAVPMVEDTGLEEELASGMYDSEDGDDADEEVIEEDYDEYRPDPLPRGIDLVDGYAVLRPRVASVVFTWVEQTRESVSRACSDPLAATFGDCEL
jgi:hypothetical protein